MATKKHHIVIVRRRREGKTDYRTRKALVIGRKPLLAVRQSNKYIYGQILKPSAKGDMTVCSSSSRVLSKQYGWKGSSKNIPAAFLTGYLLGKEAMGKSISEAIAYPGVTGFVHGSRTASLLGGAREAGLKIPLDDAVLPDDTRMKGGHVAKYATDLESKDSKTYVKTFSNIIEAGGSPKDYPKLFDLVKTAIEKKERKK
jgi:large subunit ribosomal protein L18